MEYIVVKQSFGFDPERKEKYVVKPVLGKPLSYAQLRNQVTQMCGAHRSQVSLILDSLIDVMINSVTMGHSVQLGDFGIITPTLRAKAQDSEKEANASVIMRRRLLFRPGKLLKTAIDDMPVTRYSMPVTDYAESLGTGGNDDNTPDPGGDDGEGGWQDPTA